jgi:hypothetical protein
MPVARQQIPSMHQWTSWKAVFSAQSALMAVQATVDTATDTFCFLRSPCLVVISRKISLVNSVELSEVKSSLLVSE